MRMDLVDLFYGKQKQIKGTPVTDKIDSNHMQCTLLHVHSGQNPKWNNFLKVYSI